MADDQKKLQDLSEDYQKLQTGISLPHHPPYPKRILIILELQTLISARQKLESQQQENTGVQSEFALLKDDANIYKLVGPVLLKQDKTEAVMSVNGRLEFIEKEIKRMEGQITDNENKSEGLKGQIIQLQSQAQQGQAAA